MPQSRGTRGRSTGSSQRGRGGGDARRVPAPRWAPDDLPPVPYGTDAEPAGGPRKDSRTWRLLTSNVTITVAAICVLAGTLVLVDVSKMVGGSEPPKLAVGDISTNDMLAKLTGSDMDPIAADSIAAAKKRAYERHQHDLAVLKVKAKHDARARLKLKAELERERLAGTNPSVVENKRYARKMNALKGWDRCWSSLETLWTHESSWNELAKNPSSGAYGIPQSLPASKLASAGADWRTSSPTQISWGLSYIKARYKDPCGAWNWWKTHHWY